MSAEVLKAIEQAEAAAAERIREANQKAKETADKARVDAVGLVEMAVSSQIKKNARSLEESVTRAKKEAQSQLEENKNRCAQLKQEAAPRLETAVRILCGKVIGEDVGR